MLESRNLLTAGTLVQVFAIGDAHEGQQQDAYFTIRRLDSEGPLTVQYRVGDASTATSGLDFSAPAANGQVTIPDGKWAVHVPVQALDDALVELAESIVLELVASPGYQISSGAGQASLEIVSDDKVRVNVTAASPMAYEQGAQPGAFRLSLDQTAVEDVVVSYVLQGTAERGSDYELLPSTVTIPAGGTEAQVTVIPIDDGELENTETVKLQVGVGPNYVAGDHPSDTVRIVDNDRVPVAQIEATDSQAAEQNGETGRFRVFLDQPASAPLELHFAVEGSAENGVDYNADSALSGSTVIALGQQEAFITITPVDDEQAESDETVDLRLQASEDYTLGQQTLARVTISDDDPLPQVAIVANDADASESGPDPGQFTITRSGPVTAPLTVGFQIHGTATPGVDYQPLVNAVTIPAGETSATVNVTPVNDALVETVAPQLIPYETVELVLAESEFYALGLTSSAVVHIQDNDLPMEMPETYRTAVNDTTRRAADWTPDWTDLTEQQGLVVGVCGGWWNPVTLTGGGPLINDVFGPDDSHLSYFAVTRYRVYYEYRRVDQKRNEAPVPLVATYNRSWQESHTLQVASEMNQELQTKVGDKLAEISLKTGHSNSLANTWTVSLGEQNGVQVTVPGYSVMGMYEQYKIVEIVYNLTYQYDTPGPGYTPYSIGNGQLRGVNHLGDSILTITVDGP